MSVCLITRQFHIVVGYCYNIPITRICRLATVNLFYLQLGEGGAGVSLSRLCSIRQFRLIIEG